MNLKELQTQFLNFALFNEPSHDFSHVIKPSSLTAYEHVRIYQNSVLGGLTDALSGVFPAIKNLLGSEFFNALCQIYIKEYPPKHGNLHTFGRDMAEFLFTFEHTKALPYLKDVAALEWAYHQLYHGPDEPLFDMKKLQNLPPAQFSQMVFIPSKNVAFFTFEGPIAKIWSANQTADHTTEEIHWDTATEYVMMTRLSYQPCLFHLTQEEYCVAKEVIQEKPFEVIIEHMLSESIAIPTDALLKKYIDTGLIRDIYTSEVTQ